MAYQDALVVLAQLLQLPDAAGTKANIIAIAQAASPPVDVTSMTLGEPTERWIEVASQAMGAWNSVPTQQGRAVFLRLSTDPGDVADDGVPDQSADQTPRPGWLSAFGASAYGTIREEALYATGTVTFTNNSGVPINAPPGALVFERNYASTDGANPTYHNTTTVTVNPGLSVSVSVQADQLGTYASATSGSIDHVVTQTYGSTNTVTNPSAILGRDREERQAYIERCLTAPDANSPGGPVKAYQRAATTGKDGSALQRFDGSGPTNIIGAQVSPASATGSVTGYVYGPSGHVDSTDVSSANANICGLPLGVITDPIGVLPDTVAIGPLSTDPNTGAAGFDSATNDLVAFTFSAKIRASKVPGGATPGTYTYLSTNSPPTSPNVFNVANVFTKIGLAVAAYLVGLGPGALDQDVNGNGSVYPGDILGVIRDAQAGLYDVALSLPASPVAVNFGHIATQGVTTGTLVVVAG